MRRVLRYVLPVVFAAAMGAAQVQPPPATNPPGSSGGMQTAPSPAAGQAAPSGATLAPGMVIGAELSKSIDAKKAKVGDQVVAKSLGDIRDNSGNVVIPRGTKLVGQVTQVKPASKQDPQSTVAILFDKAEPKHGQPISFHAAIQAIGRQQPSAMQEEAPMGAEGGQSGGRPPMGSPGGAGTAGRTTGGTSPGGMAGSQGQTGDMGQAGAPGTAGPALTANSRGVIGIPNLDLSPQYSPAQGSVVSSGHGNVKLDSGTLLVLRVMNQ